MHGKHDAQQRQAAEHGAGEPEAAHVEVRAVVVVRLEGDVAADAGDAAPRAGAAGAAVVQADELSEQDGQQLRAAGHLQDGERYVENVPQRRHGPTVAVAASSIIVVVVVGGIARLAPSLATPKSVVERPAGHVQREAAEGQKAVYDVVSGAASEADDGRVVGQERGAGRRQPHYDARDNSLQRTRARRCVDEAVSAGAADHARSATG